MSMNLAQVFLANPITTIGNSDLMYVVTTGTTDAAINGSSFKAQFAPLTTKGDLYTFSTVNARLAVGATNGMMLQVNSATATGLAWTTATYPVTAAVSTILYASASNVIGTLATANSSILGTTAAGVPVQLGTMTNGQMIIGSTGATPVVGTITVSGNLSATVGAGTFALALTGFAGFSYNDVAGTSQAAAVNNGYIISNAGQTTVTLPAVAAEGSVIAVQGKGAAGWILTANAGQTIHLGSSPTSVAGTLTSTNLWDAVEVICVTANTTWAVKSCIGNLTVA